MNRIFSLKNMCLVLALGFGLISCKPTRSEILAQPAKALGVVLAEEAAQAAGAHKTIALILPDAQWGPPSTLETELRLALQSKGFTVTVAKSANLGDPMRGHAGLRAQDFFEAMQNASSAGAVVSLAGIPLLAPADVNRVESDHPPILVAAITSLGNEIGLPGNRAQLENLLDAKIIQLAIVNGGEDASAATTDVTHVTFAQNYKILRGPQ